MRFSNLSHKKLIDLAKMCGGLALLVGLAVLVSAFGTSGSLVGAAACSGGGSSPCSFGNGTLTFSVGDTTVAQGGTTTITWNATGSGITSTIAAISCFGNGAGTCGAAGNPSTGGAQTLTTKNSQSAAFVQTMQFGGSWYLIVGEGWSTGTSFATNIYKWMPSSTCWGNGSVCGSYYQTLSFGSNVSYAGVVYFIDSNTPILGVEGTPASSGSNSIQVFRWTPSGSGCPSGGGFGTGPGGNCNGPLQTISPGGTAPGRAPAFATYGTKTVGVFGKQLRVWLPTQNSNRGCFGSGTSCSSTVTNFSSDPWAVKVFSFTSSPTTLPTTPSSMQPILAIIPSDRSSVSLYSWNPSLNSGTGCFGTTACWTPLANSTLYLDSSTVQSSLFEGTVRQVTLDNDGYVMLFGRAGINSVRFLYKWLSGSACLGSGSACETASTYNNNVGTYGSAQYALDGQLVDSVVTSAIWVGGSVLPMADTGPSYLGSDDLAVYGNASSPLTVYKPVSTACFGSKGTCGAVAQTFSNAAFGTNVDDSNTPSALKYFTAIGDSTNKYLVLASNIGSQTPEIYKWMSSCAGGQGGLGNGSTCGTPLQTLSNTNGLVDVDIATTTTDTYLVALPNLSSGLVKVYKWSTGSSCFGNGSACGTALTNTLPAGRSAETFSLPATPATPYVLIADLSDTGGVHMYKWNAASSCFGNGSTCGTSYQDIGAGVNIKVSTMNVFWVSGIAYLSVASHDFQSKLYKWTASGSGCPTGGGWGNGSACGTVYQTFGTDIQAVSSSAYAAGTAGYVVLVDEDYDHSPLVYKWTASGTGCPAGGGLGNGTNSCSTYYQKLSALTYPYDNSGGRAVFVPSGPDLYLAIGEYTYSTGGVNGSGQKGYVRVWKYLPASGCFGSGAGCDKTDSVKVLQQMYLVNKAGIEYIPAGTGLLAAANATGPSKLYNLSAGGLVSSCSVTATDSSGTREIAEGSSGTLITDPVSETTTYALTCTGVGSATQEVTVNSAPSVSIAKTSDASEAGPTAGVFTVTISPAPSAPVTVYFWMGGTASAADYTLSQPSGYVVVPTTGSASITLTPTVDAIAEDTETATATLTPNAAYIIGAANAATMNIADANSGIKFSAASYSVGEGGGSLTFTVVNTVPSSPVSVQYSTSNGSATAGSDYTSTSGTLSWTAAGNKTFSVPITQDSTLESNETFTVTLSNPTGTILLTPSSAQATIVDDDAVAPTINSFAPVSRVRKNGSATLNWSVSNMSAGMGCTVTPAGNIVTLQPVQWTSGNPWSGSVTTGPITAPTTFTVTCGLGSTWSAPKSTTVQLLPEFQEI